MQSSHQDSLISKKHVLPSTRHHWFDMFRLEKSLIEKRYQNAIDIAALPLHEITIQPIKQREFKHISRHHIPSIKMSSKISFPIARDEARVIFNKISTFISNPRNFMSALKELDMKLGKQLAHHDIHFTAKDLPEYLLIGMGYYLPGPPRNHHEYRHKHKLLDQLLLANEQQNGINLEGVTPIFVGIVPDATSSAFVASGHLFTEEKQVTRMPIHGSYTHRLQIYALWSAMQSGQLDLRYGNEQPLTLKQLLELMVYVRIQFNLRNRIESLSFWNILLDNYGGLSQDKYYNTKHFNHDCRSPDCFNSLLLCFGAELGLPNLQYYLLDSHWKVILKMINTLRDGLLFNSKVKLTNDRLYAYCMEAQERAAFTPSDMASPTYFSLTQEEATEKARDREIYEVFDPAVSRDIVRKKRRPPMFFMPCATEPAKSTENTPSARRHSM